MRKRRTTNRRILSLSMLLLWTAFSFFGGGRGWGLEKPDGGNVGDGKKKKEKQEKPTGPEHDVTLNEEENVLRLLKKARKARAAAEAGDPGSWPACVKIYVELLRKYPHTVYLERWAGDGKPNADKYGLGLYRSTSERVLRDLATLPPTGLKVYQVVADSEARRLYDRARRALDDRLMSRVASLYFPSSWGDDALAWLAERAYDAGSCRQALSYLRRLRQHPSSSVPKPAVLARTIMIRLRLGEVKEAEKTLAELGKVLSEKPEIGSAFKFGDRSGVTAVKALGKRIAARKAGKKTPRPTAGAGNALETYYGNAAHHRPFSHGAAVGVRTWSIPFIRLFGAPAGVKPLPGTTVRSRFNNKMRTVSLADRFPVVRDGRFFLCNRRVLVCHSLTNPEPDRPIFRIGNPPSGRAAAGTRRVLYGGVLYHPRFCTLGRDLVYAVMGADLPPPQPRAGWGRQQKSQPNWLVAYGKKRGGRLGVESGTERWSLEPGSLAAKRANPKEVRAWLKEVSFVGAPTYAAGVVYAQVVALSGGASDSLLAAFDGETGRLLWKTMICSGQVLRCRGVLQPDYGLPPAVAGGTVFVVTNLGAVAAVDAASGRPRWIRIYQRWPKSGTDRWGRPAASGPVDCWAPNPPLVVGDILIVTPQDSSYLSAFDIETGRLLWRRNRVMETDEGTERLTHVLGVARDKYLLLSGRGLTAVEVRGGKMVYQHIPQGYTLVGRGTVGDDTAFISTDRGLQSFDLRPRPGKKKPSFKMKTAVKWRDDWRREAGNVFVVGDVVLTASAGWLNAYFLTDVLERKLRARLQKNPNDFKAYVEAGDMLLRAERFDDALKYLEEGLGVARKAGRRETAAELQRRTAEVLLAAGRKAENSKPPVLVEAKKRYQAALAAAVEPFRKVEALWALGRTAAAMGDLAEALRRWTTLETTYPEVVYPFAKGLKSRVAPYVARHLARLLRRQGRTAYAALEKDARRELAAARAAGDLDRLWRTARRRLPSAASADGLFVLSGEFDKRPTLARRAALLFRRFYHADARAVEVLARYVVACEKEKRFTVAREALYTLAGDSRAQTAELKNFGGWTGPAAAWAKKRLAETSKTAPPSTAPFDLGTGLLRKVWTQSAAAPTMLRPRGNQPANLRGCVVTVESGRLVFRSRLTGKPLRSLAPRAPVGAGAGTAAWCNGRLVVAGTKELAVYDPLTGAQLRRVPFPDGQASFVAAAPDELFLTAHDNGVISARDAAGKTVWRTTNLSAQPHPPAAGEDFFVVALRNPPGFLVADTRTGAPYGTVTAENRVLSFPPVVVGDRVYTVENRTRLCAYDAVSLKLLWKVRGASFFGPTAASPDRVVVVEGGRRLVAYDRNGKLCWKTPPAGLRRCRRDLIVDKGQVLAVFNKGRGGDDRLCAYNAAGGKLLWEARIHGLPVSTGGVPFPGVVGVGGMRVVVAGGVLAAARTAPRGVLSRNDEPFGGMLTRGHVVVRCNVWDTTKRMSTGVALISRQTGKLVWTLPKSSNRGLSVVPTDGGLVVWDGRNLTGWFAADPKRFAEELKRAREKATADPNNSRVLLELSSALYERGKYSEATETALRAVKCAAKRAGAGGEEAAQRFHEAYELYARRRSVLSEQPESKVFIRFAPRSKAPKCDGKLDDWKDVPPLVLNNWKNIYLAGVGDTGKPYRRKQWRGPDDLSVSFRGGYDDKNLYLAVEVRDDHHLNDNEDPGHAWAGDSLQFAFSVRKKPGRRPGYRPGDGEFGAALGKGGKVLTWSIYAKGKYTVKKLDLPAAVRRDEKTHTTVYELAFPVEAVGVEPTRGKTFGFTFCVNDLDPKEKGLQKCAAPSPGIWEPKSPLRFARAVLDRLEKKGDKVEE